MAKKKSSKRPPAKPTVAKLRRQIDKLDRQIVDLISQRGAVAAQLRGLKRDEGSDAYDPGREADVAARAVDLNSGPLSDVCVAGVFRELVSGCRALSTPLRVAYLGPEYTYSHLAAIHRFGHSVELIPVANIAAVFDEVISNQADYGLVPVENSTDGRISDTLDRFAKTPAKVCGEVPLRIHHCLLGVCQQKDVREVYSKPQALSQCRNWLANHLPSATLIELASTSEAARLAAEKPGAAAVASRQAAVQYGLDVLAENIEDNPDNQTRFAVIGREPAARTGDDKTSLLFEVDHQPGALADAMAIFKRNRLNLTWIESFPIPGSAGRYLFFVEMQGHQGDLRLRRAIASLEKKATRLEVLGSYARMDPVG
jgi:chorismate mutase/prephenate dehydratase